VTRERLCPGFGANSFRPEARVSAGHGYSQSILGVTIRKMVTARMDSRIGIEETG